MTDPSRQSWKTQARLTSRRLLEYSIRHNGTWRTTLLYVPRHAPRGALPLVLVFHGGASGPDVIARMSAMHAVAEREGFLVAYPTGTRGRSGLTWIPGGRDAARLAGDTQFVRDLIDDLERRFDIDPTRIFAAGFSIGGSLVYELAFRFAERIAAVAVVGGTMTTTYPDPVNPVPLIHIHGTKDRRVPLEGGVGPATSAVKAWLPVRAAIDRWRGINGCVTPPKLVRKGLEGVTGYLHAGVADVELWLVEGGGHSWPGGRRHQTDGDDIPKAAAGFSASEMIWRFFATRPHSRPRRSPPAHRERATTSMR